MKKKLLSLVLAGAMVASTSVSAFAEDKTYEVGQNGQEHQVTVTGNVANSNNEVVPGTISVTVPTAVSFTINNDGVISAGDITIKNSSDEKVEVVAKSFTDTNSTNGIVLVKESDLESKVESNSDTKKHAFLKLTGTTNSVGLISEKGASKSGFVNLSNGDEIADTANTSLGTAWRDNDLRLSLSGKATKNDGSGYTAPTNPIQNNFNLVLKIQKVR